MWGGRRHESESSACGGTQSHEREQSRVTTSSCSQAARDRGEKRRQCRNVGCHTSAVWGGASFPHALTTWCRAPSNWFFPLSPFCRGCSLNAVIRKGKCEVIAVTRHGGTGRTAEGKSALEGQLVHGELVGMDQPPVPRESRDGDGSAPPPALAPGFCFAAGTCSGRTALHFNSYVPQAHSALDTRNLGTRDKQVRGQV